MLALQSATATANLASQHAFLFLATHVSFYVIIIERYVFVYVTLPWPLRIRLRYVTAVVERLAARRRGFCTLAVPSSAGFVHVPVALCGFGE